MGCYPSARSRLSSRSAPCVSRTLSPTKRWILLWFATGVFSSRMAISSNPSLSSSFLFSGLSSLLRSLPVLLLVCARNALPATGVLNLGQWFLVDRTENRKGWGLAGRFQSGQAFLLPPLYLGIAKQFAFVHVVCPNCVVIARLVYRSTFHQRDSCYSALLASFHDPRDGGSGW